MPDFQKIVRDRLAALRLEGAAEAALAEELSQHLEDRYRELISGGASEAQAAQTVTAELDDLHPLQTGLPVTPRLPRYDPVPPGDSRSGNPLQDLLRDLRFTARTILKNPLFVLFVVLTLALGIGANTTVFTVINTLILNPLPVQNASQLVSVATAGLKTASDSRVALPLSYQNLKDYQSENQVFTSLAGYTSPNIVTWQPGGAPQRLFSEVVTANYFPTLGLQPALGRFFSPDEDTTPGGHPVAVLNYATWQARFGAAPDVLGRTLRLNNLLFTIIGVAPPRFIGVNAIFGPDLWMPAAMAEQLWPNEMQAALSDRGKFVFAGVARLKPGVSRLQAQANIASIASDLSLQYPDANEGRSATVRPITDVLFSDTGSGQPPILLASAVLFVIVGIVLLIACSNVANLLMARASARRQEIGVRLAMGASRGRLIRQLLTESVFLGFLSGLVGLDIGYAGLQLLWSFLPPAVSANLVKPKLDASVFLFALLISLATGFLFGTIPAWRASRASVVDALKEDARAGGRTRGRVTFANALLVGQVAFSFLSLVTAALFLRSMQRAYDIDPGFQTKHLAIFLTNPEQAGYAKPQAKAFYKEVRERVGRLPGVDSVSWASNLPLWGRTVHGLDVEGRHARSKADTLTTALNTVDLGYFQTAGVPLVQGRDFTPMDLETSTPVAIVNEKLASDQWPGASALGKRIQLPNERFMRQIVGIAKTANYSTLGEPAQPCVYVPLEQNYSPGMTLYVRTQGDPQQMLIPVQRELQAAGPQIFVNDIRIGRTIIDNALFTAMAGVGLLTVFGFLALGLASIGLYGIMAYSVNQRRKEIGVRMAMGAARSTVLRLVLKQGMSLVLIGVLLGFAATLVVGRLLSRMLYGVSAGDPVSVFGAALVLLAVAFLACYLPARAASQVDPLVALREG